MDGLKINHLKTQTMHVCNTKIKQKGHQFTFRILLEYTTYCDEYDDYNNLNFENVLSVYF